MQGIGLGLGFLDEVTLVDAMFLLDLQSRAGELYQGLHSFPPSSLVHLISKPVVYDFAYQIGDAPVFLFGGYGSSAWRMMRAEEGLSGLAITI